MSDDDESDRKPIEKPKAHKGRSAGRALAEAAGGIADAVAAGGFPLASSLTRLYQTEVAPFV